MHTHSHSHNNKKKIPAVLRCWFHHICYSFEVCHSVSIGHVRTYPGDYLLCFNIRFQTSSSTFFSLNILDISSTLSIEIIIILIGMRNSNAQATLQGQASAVNFARILKSYSWTTDTKTNLIQVSKEKLSQAMGKIGFVKENVIFVIALLLSLSSLAIVSFIVSQ